MQPDRTFEVIVVGAGHAGIEAALAAARMGRRTLLLTQNLDTVGQMSCNPSIGGIGKGHLVRELDALGGEMAKAADASGLQFRTLQTGKGPAVRAPRVQCDKALYRSYMKRAVEAQPGLELMQDEAAGLLLEGGRLAGLRTRRGAEYSARSAVLTAGTFLKGLTHTGETRIPAGRGGEPPCEALAEELRGLGLEVGRLKTGTPPRLHGLSVDYSRLEAHPGDDPPVPVSHFTASVRRDQLPCWLGRTGEAAHRLIRENLHRSPLYSGRIRAAGPRYCPSIEDKVVKFPEKEGHRVYLEPEGRGTHEVYANGLFTSLPEDLQWELVRSIPGLERARIVRPGYAVEYDFVQPTQLSRTFELRAVPGLFLAGQVNGTTGYEEAAGQGLLAGINAALAARQEPPFVLRREEAYLGVLADDLVTRGVDEPYRMFTARAEHRLSLRCGNADLRLMERGRDLGLVPEDAFRRFERYRRALEELREGREPAADDAELAPWSLEGARAEAEVERRYRGYIEAEARVLARRRPLEEVPVPAGLDFAAVAGLSAEPREKLRRVRPSDLAQAARVPGVTPSDVQLLWVHLERLRREEAPR